MSTQQLKQKGFTIIEVVLVLAIAALIFLMVFIALPALQRNQRDTARKTILGKVSSAVTTYQSNKRGAQPANGVALNGYIDGVAAGSGIKGDVHNTNTTTATDSLIDNQFFVRVGAYPVGGATVGVADTNFVQVFTGAKCNTTGDSAIVGSTRNAAILIEMENGNSVNCQTV